MMQPLTEEQTRLFEDYQRSGMKKRDYCRMIGIQLYKLDYILSKEKALQNTVIELVKVKSIDKKTSSLILDINNLTLLIDNDTDEDLLRKVLRVLRT